MTQKTVTRSIFSFSKISQINLQVNAVYKSMQPNTETANGEIMETSIIRRSNKVFIVQPILQPESYRLKLIPSLCHSMPNKV